MKPSKKNILTTGLAVVLAAAAVLGGTFGYLQDSTENVTNTFKANQVTVSLKETTGMLTKSSLEQSRKRIRR